MAHLRTDEYIKLSRSEICKTWFSLVFKETGFSDLQKVVKTCVFEFTFLHDFMGADVLFLLDSADGWTDR